MKAIAFDRNMGYLLSDRQTNEQSGQEAMKQRKLSREVGFTLVELLVVVALIGLLISITIPVAGSMIENARKNAARVDMNLIANAVEAYYAEYRYLPPGVPASGVIRANDFTAGRQVLSALQGENPRQKMFLQPQGGTPEPYYLDPWSPDRENPTAQGNLQYEMRFRRQETLSFPFFSGANQRTANFRNRQVVLFSYGRDRQTGNAVTGQDDVYSFDPKDY